MAALLDFEASTSRKHADGYTALHVAAALGFLEGVELLHHYACDLSCKDNDLMTPLMLAAGEGHLDVVHYLVHQIGSIEPGLNSNGLSPLVMAALMVCLSCTNKYCKEDYLNASTNHFRIKSKY